MLYEKPCGSGVCVCVYAHICVFRDTHMFQLTAGAEMDNQEGREPESVCTSVTERDHLSQRSAKVAQAWAWGDWPRRGEPLQGLMAGDS